jgi:hypothetical protein
VPRRLGDGELVRLRLHLPTAYALPAYSDAKVENRNVRVSGGRSLTGPFRDAHRFPFDTIVARTGGYAWCWDFSPPDVGMTLLLVLAPPTSIVQGPFSVAPCQTANVKIAVKTSRPRPSHGDSERVRRAESVG